MPRFLSILAVVSLTTAPAVVAAQGAAPVASPQVSGQSAAPTPPPTKPARVVVRPKSRGYGFLPGYEPPDRPSPRGRPSFSRFDGGPPRYLGWWGQPRYGWGGAGFAGSRWNGGSFGPCWTYTPVGMVWNCGR